MENTAKIENNFKYHPPTGQAQVEKYEFLRSEFKALAHEVDAKCPMSREKSLAMTALEEASMWANAAIARNS